MTREYRPNAREFAVVSKLDHDRENKRQRAVQILRDRLEEMSNRIAIKLLEDRLIETTGKDDLEAQIRHGLETLVEAEEFETQMLVANIRNLVPRPHFVSLYVTAWVIEKLIDHKCVLEVFGTDEQIYRSVNSQVIRFIPL